MWKPELALLAVALCGASCSIQTVGASTNVQRTIDRYGCGTCHQIGGMRSAHGRVGPSLRRYRAQRFVAGTLENTTENVSRWIMDPQAIRPGSAMPKLDVTAKDASAIALYILEN